MMELHLKSHFGRYVLLRVRFSFSCQFYWWGDFHLNWVKKWLENIFGFLADWRIAICCTSGETMWTFVLNVLWRQGVSLYRIIFQYPRPECLLFTGQLGVEAGESNAEGLDCAHRVLVIHGEDVLGYPSELHNDVLIVWIMNYLEILNRGLQIMTINHIQIRPSPTWVTLPWKFKT